MPVVLEVNPKPTKTEFPCTHCGSSRFITSPLALTWSSTWMAHRVIGSFVLAHVPSENKDSKNQSWTGMGCVKPERVEWITLDDLRADPEAFIELLASSDLRITPRAVQTLADLLGWEYYPLAQELGATE